MRAGADPKTSEGGFALLIAIGFLLAATAIIAPFVLAARTALDAAAATLRSDRLEFAAEGLLTAIARRVAAMPDDERSAFAEALRSGPAGCRAGGLVLELRLQDQRGLVDLNAASEPLLEAGLRAVGLDPAAAAVHAAAIAAHRSSEAGSGHPFPPLAGALARDGLKGAPIEAVEELHDFAALAAVPPSTLLRTFTVHSRQPQIVGPMMPDALALHVPRRAGPGFPFVLGEAGGAGTYRVDVVIRAPDGTVGHAGQVAAVSGGGLTILEGAASPHLLAAARAEPVLAASCGELFGPAALLLQDLA